jgi:hypothetical protein
MNIFKFFENQSDTYHDTWTHYFMEQDPLLLQNQVDGMDVVVVEWRHWRRRMGPPGPGSSQYGYRS